MRFVVPNRLTATGISPRVGRSNSSAGPPARTTRWVIYAGYLHARATPSVKRSVATWIAVVGWGTMMINLFAINLVVTGLHSYAGVK